MASANVTDKTNDAADPVDPGSAQEKMKPIEGGRMYSAGDVRIVVIDDDPAVGRLVQATLAGHEFSIDVVSDPKKSNRCCGRCSIMS